MKNKRQHSTKYLKLEEPNISDQTALLKTYEVEKAANAPMPESVPPKGTVILRGMPKALGNARPVRYTMDELEEISKMKEKSHYFTDAVRGGVTL